MAQAQDQQTAPAPVDQGTEEEQNQLKLAMLAANMNQQPTSPTTTAVPASSPVTGPIDPTTLSTSTQPLPPAPASPAIDLGHADFASQPAAQDVAAARAKLDKFQHPALWRQLLVPGLIGAASALGAHSWGGRQLAQEAGDATKEYLGNIQSTRQSLIQQLQNAQARQQAEYEADQRNRQQDIMLSGQNQERSLLGQVMAANRLAVANTAAQSRENVAQTNVGGRESVATTEGQTARDVAGIKGGFDIQKAKIDAQAALDRFLAGEGYEDRRQQSTFAHSDLKPTADEDRRADLSQAMSGYADMLEDIARRRPDLFGPLAGRVTQAKQFFGSDDPDVANLKFLREQLGITQMGAHSLRSAQAIAPIADALANSFHNDAATVIATAEMAKKGVAQFYTPQRPVVNGRGPTPAPAPVPGTRPPLSSRVPSASMRPAAGAIFATNGRQRIFSNDGQKTWYDAATGQPIGAK